MKTICSIWLLVVVSMGSYAQKTDTLTNKASLLNYNTIFRAGITTNPVIPGRNFSLSGYPASRFTMYSKEDRTKSVLYDNYRDTYIYGDPFCPFSTPECALIGGALNYLFLALDPKSFRN